MQSNRLVPGIIVAVAALASEARADLGFEYRARLVADNLVDCEPIAQMIARQFVRATGREVISATCDAFVTWQQDVLIHYAGETRLPLYSTWYEWAHRQGMYQTKDACVADLQQESETFKRLTGLEPVAAYCYAESSLPETPHSWVSRVDGLGSAQFKPFTLEQTIYGIPERRLGDIGASVASSLEMFGVHEAKVVADSDGYSARLTARFYAEYRPPIDFVQYTSHKTLASCQASVPELSMVLEAAGGSILDHFCVRHDFSELADLVTLVHVRGSYELREIEGRYASMESCRNDRDRLMRVLRTQQGLDPAGAICDYDEGQIISPDGYAMQVFLRN